MRICLSIFYLCIHLSVFYYLSTYRSVSIIYVLSIIDSSIFHQSSVFYLSNLIYHLSLIYCLSNLIYHLFSYLAIYLSFIYLSSLYLVFHCHYLFFFFFIISLVSTIQSSAWHSLGTERFLPNGTLTTPQCPNSFHHFQVPHQEGLLSTFLPNMSHTNERNFI